MGKFFRRYLDELATGVFLLLVMVITILDPPVFATRGGQLLARWALSSAAVLVVVIWIAARASSGARSALHFVLQWGIILVWVVGYVSLKLLHAGVITTWLGILPLDHWMMAADDLLFGKTPYLWLAQWGFDKEHFLQVMSGFYALYPFTPPLLLGWFWFRREVAQFQLVRRALIISFSCGYTCYLLLPVSGPLSLVNASTPNFLESTRAYSFLADNYRYAYDCFPSLHTANPWLMVWLSRGKLPAWLMAALAVAACGITLSTIALDVHYGVDDLAGLVWVFLIAPLAQATLPREAAS